MINSGANQRATARRARAAARRIGHALICAAAFETVAPAASVTWDGGGGGGSAWNVPANWNPDAVPTAADDVTIATFPTPLNLGGGTARANSLTVNHGTAFEGLVIQGGTLNLSGANAAGDTLSTKSPLILEVPVMLGDPNVAGGVTTATFRANGGLTLGGGVVKANPGQVVNLAVSGSVAARLGAPGATFGHDDTNVNGGTLYLPAASPGRHAFGTGRLTVGSGELRLAAGGAGVYELSNPVRTSNWATLNLTDVTGASYLLTGAIELGAGLSVASPIHLTGGPTPQPASPQELRGTITLAGGDREISYDSDTAGPLRLTGRITEDAPGRKLTLRTRGDQPIVVAGAGNAWSGGTVIAGQGYGYVEVAAGSRLGTGPVEVQGHAELRLNDAGGAPGPASITAKAWADVHFASTPAAAAVAAMHPASAGTLSAADGFAGADLHAGGHHGLFLGSLDSQTVTAPWTPAGGVYRLAGARQSAPTAGAPTLTLGAPNLLTGPTRSLIQVRGGTRIGHAQDFGGGTTLESGTIVLAHPQGLGSGSVSLGSLATLVLDAGALPAGAVFEFRNPLNVQSRPSLRLGVDEGTTRRFTLGDLTIGSDGLNVYRGTGDGSVTVTGRTVLAASAPLDVPSLSTALPPAGVDVAFAGPVAAPAGVPFLKTGAGAVGLFNPGNTITGVDVRDGVVAFDSAGALGVAGAPLNLAGALRYQGATDLPVAAPIRLVHGALEAEGAGRFDVTATAITYGTLNSASLRLGGAGDGRLAATIPDALGGTRLYKSGAGAWTVTGDNAFTGGTTVEAGTLRMGNATALGAAPGPLRVDDGTLDLAGHDLSAGGLAGDGAGGRITSTVPGALALRVAGAANETFNGSIADGAAVLSFEKGGKGALTLNGVHTYTGATDVRGGTLTLRAGARLAGTSALVVRGGAGVVATAVPNGAPSALPDNVSVTLGDPELGGGLLTLRNESYSGTAVQRISTLALRPGGNALDTGRSSSQSIVISGQIGPRPAGATLEVSRGYSQTVVHASAPPPLIGKILGGAFTAGDQHFLTVGPGGTLVPFTAHVAAADPNDVSAGGWVAANDVQLTAPPAAPMAASRTVNSVTLAAAAGTRTASLDLAPGATLTVVAGGLMNPTPAATVWSAEDTTWTVRGGALTVPAAVPDLVVSGSGDTVIESRLDLAGRALVKVGGGTLTVDNAANEVDDVFVNGGTLALRSGASLGDRGGTIHLFGGTMRVSGGEERMAGKAWKVGAGGATLTASSAALDVEGPVRLNGDLTVGIPLDGGPEPAARSLTFSGGVSGPGALVHRQSWVQLRLPGANTFTGGVRFPFGGAIAVGDDRALGSGPLWVDSGYVVTLTAMDGAARTLPNPLDGYGGVRVGLGGAVTFTGPVTMSGTISSNNTVPTVLTAPLRGGQAMRFAGTGVMVLAAPSPDFFGTITVVAGTLRAPALPRAAVTVRRNATLELAGTVDLKSLTVDDGGRAKVAPGLSTAAALGGLTFSGAARDGTLDIADNGLVVYTADIGSIRGAIFRGYASGRWNAGGLTSSAAAADSRLAIGYAQSWYIPLGPDGTFIGEPLTSAAVLVRTTLKGDANLDGSVDFTDLVSLAQWYNQHLVFDHSNYWHRGDFNYDGWVNFQDLVMMAQNYNTSLANVTPAAAAAGRSFDADFAAALATVPEPATGALAMAAGVTLGRRRRRR